MSREGEGGRASQDRAVAVRYGCGANARQGKTRRPLFGMQKGKRVQFKARRGSRCVLCAGGEGMQCKAGQGGRCAVES